MSKIPSAWDDDPWTVAAGRQPSSVADAAGPRLLSREERKSQHQSANRKLWEAAEAPGPRSYYLETQNVVPLESSFKPQVKVLSRKPTSAAQAGDDDDSETERRAAAERSLAERQRKAAEERAEKQRKYAEARERIMGPASIPFSTGVAQDALSTPGSRPGSRQNSSSRRGGKNQSGPRTGGGRQVSASTEHSPARAASFQPQLLQTRQLFDPRAEQRRDSRPGIRNGTTSAVEAQVLRMPRGPDSSGRGGFASRGGKAG